MLHRMRFLRNIEGGGGAGAGAPPVAPPVTPPAPTGPPPSPAPVTPPAGTPAPEAMPAWAKALVDQAQALKAEVVDMRRENRKAGVGNAPPVAPTPESTAAEMAAMRREMSFRDAVDFAGVNLNPEQRKDLRTLHDHAGDVGDVSAWIKQKVQNLGWGQSTAPGAAPQAAAAPPAPVAPVQTPAPAGTAAGSSVLPKDPSKLTQAQIDALTPAEAKKIWDEWNGGNGRTRHPFHAARQAEEATKGGAEALAAALRGVLNGSK